MKLAFTGDIVLQELEENPQDIFGEVQNYLNQENVNLIVNLESPFFNEVDKPIKEKLTLGSNERNVNYIQYLNPLLVNLSNNHINDYGNNSSIKTQEVLKAHNLKYFGIGYINNRLNTYIDSDEKYILASYTTRSADFTCKKLFAEDLFIGPYPPDFKQVMELRSEYPDYNIILSIHWGIEDIKYPEPDKRKLAYELIDAGADLIIGHHPHIIQPIEKYKNKYIFYSLGNFYFPKIKYYHRNRLYIKRPLKHHKMGLIPIFQTEQGELSLIRILKVKQTQGSLKIKEFRRFKYQKKINTRYVRLYKYYIKLMRLKYYIQFAINNPKRILNRLVLLLNR